MVQTYLACVREFCAKFGPERIMNMDQTAWPNVQGRRKVIARKGTKIIFTVVKGNEKAIITVVVTVRMSAGNQPESGNSSGIPGGRTDRPSNSGNSGCPGFQRDRVP
jgi:hypothetical protein